MDLRLVIIAPIPNLKRPDGKRLYRQPGYLICTDVDLPLETLLQEYIWRWDIEVNHRDENLGVGQAQVRNANSVASVPAAAVAAYAMLHVAAMKAYGWNGKPGAIPEAKWRNPKKKNRASTQDLVNELRRELWSESINPKHLTDFRREWQPRGTYRRHPACLKWLHLLRKHSGKLVQGNGRNSIRWGLMMDTRYGHKSGHSSGSVQGQG